MKLRISPLFFKTNIKKILAFLAYGSSLIFLIYSVIQRSLLLYSFLPLVGVNITSLVAIIYLYKGQSSLKKAPKKVESPWGGEPVEAPPQPKIGDETFGKFAEKNLASAGKKLFTLKMPNFARLRLFRKAMRLVSAGLIIVYSVVFFFSLGSPIAIMFIATDIVLFYNLWLSRR